MIEGCGRVQLRGLLGKLGKNTYLSVGVLQMEDLETKRQKEGCSILSIQGLL